MSSCAARVEKGTIQRDVITIDITKSQPNEKKEEENIQSRERQRNREREASQRKLASPTMYIAHRMMEEKSMQKKGNSK